MIEERKPSKAQISISKIRWIERAAIVIALILIVAGGVVWWHACHSPSSYSNDSGNFGSYLQGAVGSLWSLGGLLFVLVAFLAQKQQIIQQQEELEEERKSRNRQNFESTLFQLLHLQNSIVEGIRITQTYRGINQTLLEVHEETPSSGRDCFEVLYQAMKRSYSDNVIDTKLLNATGKTLAERDTVIRMYQQFYLHHQAHVGHYFRNLFHIFKYIRDHEPDNPLRYASWVRAQLSSYELALLFYNSITPIPPENKNEFQSLIEEYCLFKTLDCDSLLITPDHKALYASRAFTRDAD